MKGVDLVNISSRRMGSGTYKYLGGSENTLFYSSIEMIEKIRKDNDAKALLSIRNKILESPIASKKIFREKKLNPKRPQDRIVFSSTSLMAQSIWAMGYVRVNVHKLKDFVLAKSEIYKLYYLGEFKEAIEQIDAFSQKRGYAYCLLDLRMAILQNLGGLDAQKTYRNTVIKDYGAKNYAWVASLFSERSEEKVTFENFSLKINKSNVRWTLPEIYQKFYKHLTTRSLSISKSDYSELINVNTQVSLYDLYENICETYDLFPEEFIDEDVELIKEIRFFGMELFLEYKSIVKESEDMLSRADLTDSSIRSTLAKYLLFYRYLPGFTVIWLTFRKLTTGSFDEWSELNYIEPIIQAHNYQNQMERQQIFSYIEEGNYLDSTTKIVELINKDPENLFILPIEKASKYFILEEELHHGFANRSSIIDVYMRQNQDPELKDRAFWYFEDFLDELEVSKPTELSDGVFPSRESLLYFLKYTANYSNLSFLDSLPTTRNVDNEKVSLLIKLIELDNFNADLYKDQLASILTRMSIQDGMKIVDQSRIYVDTKSITKYSKISYDHTFLRYRNLVQNLNIFILNTDNIKKALDSRTDAELFKYLDIPQDEASTLISLLVEQLKEHYLFDPEYGLNAFLSMRVRHGTLPGTLRGAAQEDKLIVIKDKDGSYIPPTEWLGYDQGKYDTLITNTLIELTKGFEKILNDNLQPLFYVKTDQNRQGRLEILIDVEDLGEIHGHVRTNPGMNFEKFNEVVFSIFRNKLTASLDAISEIINIHIRQNINEIFFNAHEELKEINSENIERLRGVLTKVRTETGISLDLIRSWLSVTDSDALDADFSIGQMLNIGLEMSKKLTRGFSPQIHLPDELEDRVNIGLVKELTDIIVIVIDNASKYSGMNDPNIFIEINKFERGIKFRFTTEMASAPTPDQLQNIEDIKELIVRNKYLEKLQTEGKSGLIKIKRIISNYRRNEYLFFYKDNNFIIEFFISAHYEKDAS